MRWIIRLLFLSALLVWVFFQTHFINADAVFHSTSIGRGDWTDEGLNTFQLRNYINHHQLDLNSGDDLIKTPLFNAALYIPLSIFGNTFTIARIFCLLVVLVLMVLMSRYSNQKLGLLVLLIPLMHDVVFQYSHLAMAEMMATMCIALSILLLHRAVLYPDYNKWRLVSATFLIVCACYLKLQFAYVLPIIPLYAMVTGLSKKWMDFCFQKIAVMFLCAAIGIAFYFFCWYLPLKHIFQHQLSNQSFSFQINNNTPHVFFWNIFFLWQTAASKIYLIAFIICLPLGFWLMKKSDVPYRHRFLLSLCWVILESGKLTMTYLPHRYMVSFWFALGFMMSIVFLEMFTIKTSNYFKRATVFFIAVISVSQMQNIWWQNHHRTYAIQTMNRNINSTDMKNKTVIGVWATGMAWNCGATVLPVWNQFVTENPVEQLKPDYIFSEPNEADSDEAFLKHGIHLNQFPIYKKTIVGSYQINCYSCAAF